ncbi:Ribbon-helix-helix domain-containing protein, partial [Anaerobranca californiensis DSM 14826]
NIILLGGVIMSLKNRIRIGSAIDKKLYEEIKMLSEKTRIPMSKLLDEAIEDLIKKYKKL